jgi:hypothetical protein
MKVTEMLSNLTAAGAKESRKLAAKGNELAKRILPSAEVIDSIRRKVKIDHAAALELWASGRQDARVLATMIADAGKVTSRHVDSWRNDLTDRVVASALGELAARGKVSLKDVSRWCDDEHEWTSVLGWSIVVHQAADPRIPDEFFIERLDQIRDRAGIGSSAVNELMADALALIAERPSLTDEVFGVADDIMERWQLNHEPAAKAKPAAAATRKATKKKPAAAKLPTKAQKASTAAKPKKAKKPGTSTVAKSKLPKGKQPVAKKTAAKRAG